MPLISNGRLADDSWAAVADDEALPATGPVIVSLDRWQADRDALLARGGLLGVRLASHQLAAEIAADLAHFDLVALEFPTFRDGRAYSTARLLRERYGFAGELRAVGNVLCDQFMFMHRCGFDAFEVADDRQAEAWHKAMNEISVWYQPAADGRVPVKTLRHFRSAAE
jgi:uncharacterized protein (DUF934 family)